jgi:hypothetical protein
MRGLLRELFQTGPLNVAGLRALDNAKKFWKDARGPIAYNSALGYVISGGYALAAGVSLGAAVPLILGSTILGALAYPIWRLGRYLYKKMYQPTAQPRTSLAYGY